jgi:hypothetical protein
MSRVTSHDGVGYPFRVRDEEGYRLLGNGALMTAATAARAGLGCVELWSARVPPLVKLASELADSAAPGQSPHAGPARGRLRDEMLALARESAEVVLREVHRGVEDLDTFTRPHEETAGDPKRRARAKP